MKHIERFQQLQDIPRTIQRLKQAIYIPVASLSAEAWVTPEPVPFDRRKEGQYHPIQPGEKWGDLWDCAWFHLQGTVPDTAVGESIVFILDVNGEGCLFDEKGCPTRGITNVNSQFDTKLGRPGKRIVPFLKQASGGETADFWMEAGCNDLFGRFCGNGTVVQLDIAICKEDIRQLYYDMLILWEIAQVQDTESARYASIIHTLYRAGLLLTDITPESVAKAHDLIAPELDKAGESPSLKIHAIGHAHIDLAWLWPIRETIRKGARTFSTALELMERYPDYIFGASQPQLFSWMKEYYPALYSKIAQRVKDGRIEPQGAMWVEADTNLSGGESLIRQCLYGKSFFKKEFGKDIRVLWLPDVFGYTAALPQILKKCGVDYFCTIKLSWNTYNEFPFHTFHWYGLDGSHVLAHMPPEGTYNSAAAPSSIQKAERNYAEKGICDEALLLFGIGDGGGGPGPEHLERLKRLKNAAGLPPVHQAPAIDFFEEIGLKQDEYPEYHGELYLEKHQGTYTTQAKNKRYNRLMERLLHDAELLCSMHWMQRNEIYPREQLESIWKEVLLYQFHDIIPGSSIRRVYEESLERYAQLEQQVESLINQPRSDSKLAVFNSLGWERTAYVEDNTGWKKLQVPAMGIHPVQEVKPNGSCIMADGTLENACLKVRFNDQGEIVSLVDKRTDREVAISGQPLHQWRLFVDEGDAWDISIDYRNKPAENPILLEVSQKQTMVSVERRQVWRIGNSRLIQRVILWEDCPYVDFQCTVDWQEKKRMLRVDFPLRIQAENCTCDIQFGHIHRNIYDNTSLDYAQFEICAHKWVDISDGGYGVALINNCKYGYSVRKGQISLNLLRATNYPGESADIGEHAFSYALYLHDCPFTECLLERTAYEYNYPVYLVASDPMQGTWLETDTENVVIETVKVSEDGRGLVVRLYENKGKETAYTLTCGFDPWEVWETNMLEQAQRQIAVSGRLITDTLHPFEIRTLLICREGR